MRVEDCLSPNYDAFLTPSTRLQRAEDARTLYKKGKRLRISDAPLRVILVGCVEGTGESKDDDSLATGRHSRHFALGIQACRIFAVK
jgi:hypothetical protein